MGTDLNIKELKKKKGLKIEEKTKKGALLKLEKTDILIKSAESGKIILGNKDKNKSKLVAQEDTVHLEAPNKITFKSGKSNLIMSKKSCKFITDTFEVKGKKAKFGKGGELKIG